MKGLLQIRTCNSPFIQKLHEYIYYYNNERISLKLKMSPINYRTQSQII